MRTTVKLLCVIFSALILLSAFSACNNSAHADNSQAQLENFPGFASYRDIPGVTAEEIAAVEKLLETYSSFSYGMVPSSEAFVKDDGTIGGFSALFCDWLTELFGVDFTPQLLLTANIFEVIQSGGVDFSGDIRITEQRRADYFYTEPIAMRSIVRIRIDGSESIDSISKTRLPRYAFLRDTVSISDVANAIDPNSYETVLVDATDPIYKMLKDGEFDAFIAPNAAEGGFAVYYDVLVEDFLPLIFSPVSMVTTNPELEPIINMVQKAIENGAEHYLSELYNEGYRDFRSHKLFMRLTPAEISYIENNPIISFAVEYDRYPISFFNTRYSEWQGISVDVTKEIEALTGLQFAVLHDDGTEWSELLRMVESGEALILSELVRTKEREKDFIWADSYFFTDRSALLSKEEFRDINIQDVYSVKVGIIKNDANSEMFAGWFPEHENTTEYESNKDAFDALMRDEVDMVMSSYSSLLYLTNYQEVTGYKANFIFNNNYKSTFGFNKDAEILSSIVDKAMVLVDSDAISEQWLRRNYDYRLKIAEARSPWIIGVVFLLFSVLVLMLALFKRALTERRRLGELVQERTASLDLLFESNPQINFLFSNRFRLIDCNSTAYRNFGFESKEAALKGLLERLNKSIPRFQPSGAASVPLSKRLERAVKNGSEKFETELTIENNTRTFDVQFIKIPYEKSFAVVAYAFDITELHNRETELLRVRELNELQLVKLDLMLKATKIGLWDMEVVKSAPVHPANTFVWSDAFRQMLGFTDESDFPNVLGSWSDRLHPDDKYRVLSSFEHHMFDKSGKTPYDVEYRLKKKDGEYAYFRASGATIRDEKGNPIRVAGSLMDITETKNILFETEKQRIQAEAASKAKGDFLSIMSHEMRTPMNAIIGMTAIGKKAEDTAQKDAALKKIEDASSHLLGVINDVLDMAKIEADKLELAPIEYSFEKMLQKVINFINFRVAEKQQDFSVKVDENIPSYLIGDSQRLAQVITNLLSNAVKFTPEGGKISLRADLVCEKDGVCELQIEVKDSGIGIDASQQQRMFLAFEQASRETSRKFGGTGLGLVISKRIVELMGGEISVKSEINKGSTFTFTAKAKRGEKKSSSLKSRGDEPEILEKDGEFAGKYLLLAEDIDINREILAVLLENSGISIDFAENGKQALDMVTANPDKYDVVFMDVQMPVMDGLTATREIRALFDKLEKSEKTQNTARQKGRLPIIALTANVFKDDIETCIAAGMDDHLGKPFDIVQVVEKLTKQFTIDNGQLI